jgi:hypothetical protein
VLGPARGNLNYLQSFYMIHLLRPSTTFPIHPDGVKHPNSLKQRANRNQHQLHGQIIRNICDMVWMNIIDIEQSGPGGC